MTTAEKRQRRVDRYLRAATIGSAAILAFPFLNLSMQAILSAENPNLPLFVALMAAAFLMVACHFVSIGYLFFRRKTDEFTLSLWHSATTFAFFGVAVWLMIGGHVEDSIQGSIYYDTWSQSGQTSAPEEILAESEQLDVIERFSLPIMLAAFYLGFQIKRLRG